jgi:hypothetical protein
MKPVFVTSFTPTVVGVVSIGATSSFLHDVVSSVPTIIVPTNNLKLLLFIFFVFLVGTKLGCFFVWCVTVFLLKI